MTNSPCIARKLSQKCPNTREHTVHDHVVLINGRAKAAQVYPPALCRAVCSGLIEQMEADRKGQFLIASVDVNEKMDTKQMLKEAENIKTKYKTIEEDNDDTLEVAWEQLPWSTPDNAKELPGSRFGVSIMYLALLLCLPGSTLQVAWEHASGCPGSYFLQERPWSHFLCGGPRERGARERSRTPPIWWSTVRARACVRAARDLHHA